MGLDIDVSQLTRSSEDGETTDLDADVSQLIQSSEDGETTGR